ncbi:MAG: flagellum-specific ATP synthase FliI, partial [Rhodobacteraceae bacterium]
YASGSDRMVDAALKVWPELDAFIAEDAPDGTAGSFARLAAILAQVEG